MIVRHEKKLTYIIITEQVQMYAPQQFAINSDRNWHELRTDIFYLKVILIED